MIGFELIIENLRNIGFYNFFLPWILVLSIVYGILVKTEVFGDNKSVNAIVSIAISFIFLGGLYAFIPHNFFAIFFSRFAILIVVLLAIAILLGFFGIKMNELGGNAKFKWIIFAIISAVLIVMTILHTFSISVGFGGIGRFFSSEGFLNAIYILIMIGVMVLVIWLITKGD